MQLKRDLQVVVVVHTRRNRYAVLFSTDVDLEPQRLYRYYKARFQIEFLFRDAKQFTGLSDCQARSKAKLDFHFNASLSAVTFAKLEARHQHGHGGQAFSMASLKRRAFNQHLIDRIGEHLAHGQSLEKSSPDYEKRFVTMALLPMRQPKLCPQYCYRRLSRCHTGQPQ